MLTTTVFTSRQVTGRHVARTSHRDVLCKDLSPYQHHHGVSQFSNICSNPTHSIIFVIDSPIVANISLYNDPQCQFPTTLDVHTGNGCVLSFNSGLYVAF